MRMARAVPRAASGHCSDRPLDHLLVLLPYGVVHHGYHLFFRLGVPPNSSAAFAASFLAFFRSRRTRIELTKDLMSRAALSAEKKIPATPAIWWASSKPPAVADTTDGRGLRPGVSTVLTREGPLDGAAPPRQLAPDAGRIPARAARRDNRPGLAGAGSATSSLPASSSWTSIR